MVAEGKRSEYALSENFANSPNKALHAPDPAARARLAEGDSPYNER